MRLVSGRSWRGALGGAEEEHRHTAGRRGGGDPAASGGGAVAAVASLDIATVWHSGTGTACGTVGTAATGTVQP